MKKLLPFIILFALGCKKDPVNPSSPPPPPPAPGVTYFIIGPDTFWCDQTSAYYSISNSATLIAGYDTNTTGSFILFIPTQQADSVGVNLGSSGCSPASSGVTYCNVFSSMEIDTYGSVGNLIEGSFTGAFKDCNNASVQVPVSGVFSIIRTADQ